MHRNQLMTRRLPWGLVMVALALAGWLTAPAAAAQEEFADPSLLVSTEELEDLLSDVSVRVIDLRPTEKFHAGHIPQALSLPAVAVLDSTSRIEGARRGDAELAQIFGLLGIGKDNHVVLYDDKGGHEAARILWILHYLGHQNVGILDGGFPKWEEEGRQVTQQTRQVKRESFPVDLTPRRLATAEWILDHMSDADVLIIDVRPADKYADSHIPGAINLPWRGNLTPDEVWKEADQLRGTYESAGVTPDKNIVVYCQGGFHNAHTYVTLRALGYPRVRSYDLAWPEWGSDPSLPKSQGPSPGSAEAFSSASEQSAGGPQQDESADGARNWTVVRIGVVVILLAILGIIGVIARRGSRQRTPSDR